ncbi:MAG TPA: Mu-like prophage major head subunit gpT family protein [Sphingobium sp.]
MLQALRTGFKKSFQNGVAKADPTYEELVTPVGSSTKVETYGWLGSFPTFRRWVGAKRVKSLEERAYVLMNEDFEATLGIHKNKIRDDNLGLYGPIVQGWGEQGGALKDRLAYDALSQGHLKACFDGQNYFDVNHPVGDALASNMSGDNSVQPWFLADLSKPLKPLLMQTRQEPEFAMVTDPEDSYVFQTGEFLMGGEARAACGYTFWQLAHRCTGALNEANYTAACQAMAALKDDEGEPLEVRPTHIVVGTSNKVAARNLFKKANLAGGESNIWFDDVQIKESRRLA